jgi:hypothetical protein
MNDPSTVAGYELRFIRFFGRACGYAFPCDAQGRVDIDTLSEYARNDYIYARALVGRDLLPPVVASVR